MPTKILIGKDYLSEVLNLINSAKHSIFIIIFDWRIYPTPHNTTEQALLNAILKAQARNVHIKVIANNDYVKDRLNALNIPCKHTKFYKIIHAKLILIDEKIAVLGSHNFTNNAFDRNLEISASIDDPENVKILTDYFIKLWN